MKGDDTRCFRCQVFRATSALLKRKEKRDGHLSSKATIMADNGECERIFKRFDSNGDGKISASELGDAMKAFGSISPDDAKRMMDAIDKDGDGFISFEEFSDFARDNRALMKDFAKAF